MWSQPRISRTRQGQFELRLPAVEREVLRALPAQLREELREPDSTDLRRLFPPAHAEDERLNEEYRSLVGDGLLAGKRRAADVMEATVDATRLDEEQVLAWLSTVNDLRLILGSRLGVTDDRQDEVVPDGDPRAQAYALYHYLGFLEEQFVEALSEALPG